MIGRARIPRRIKDLMAVPLRVLMSPSGEGDGANATVAMLRSGLPADVDVISFTWPRAFCWRYDVLHVHWPEALLRTRPSRVIIKRVAFLIMLALNRLQRRPIVWTVHNRRPHERGDRAEALFLRLWDRSVSARVYLYDAAVPAAHGGRDVVIPHGAYAPLHGVHPKGVGGLRGRLLAFGLLRRYKKVEDLIDAVGGVGPGAGIEVMIAGRPMPQAYLAELQRRAERLPNVMFDPRSLPDIELAAAIEDAELVVLTHREIYNSGAALLALTLGRPVLVRASATMAELRAEVGMPWVQEYDGDLTADVLLQALATVRQIGPGAAPDLRRRDWNIAGTRHAELYRSLVAE